MHPHNQDFNDRGPSMLFTQIARFISVASIFLGVAGLIIGFSMSSNAEDLTTAKIGLSGMLIENGFTCFLFGVILGVLTDISGSISDISLQNRIKQ